MVEELSAADLVDDWSDLSTSDLAAGARLGRYELLLPIAFGGMARVWAARQHGTRGFTKLVAIKTILPHLARDPEFERMFLDEARIAAGVHHPNVCEIYELGEEGHCLYLAMEWVNGESLVHILRPTSAKDPSRKTTHAIEPRVAARIVSDALAGLHAAHELQDDDGKALGVVHRDISPHNVLISLDGHVKVADFGVAKAYGQAHAVTVAGQIKGKVAYMAPEQISGAQVDRRSDVYSMGCVLYEATTGEQPFKGENDPQIMQQVLRGTFAPPSRVVKGFPFELERIIVRALAPDPARRYATAEAMRAALEEWLVKSGAVVLPSQVASVVRARVGAELDKRKERLRIATQSSADASGGYAPATVERTPSHPSGGSRSGVNAAPPMARIPSAHDLSAQAAQAAQMRTPMAPPPMRSPLPSNPQHAPNAALASGISPVIPSAVASPSVVAASPTPAPPVVALSSGADRGTRNAMVAAVVAGLLVVAALGAMFVARSEPPLASAKPALAPAAAAAGSLAQSAAISSAASAPAPLAAAAPDASSITFRVEPPDAILIVAGKELEPGKRTMPRPPPGVVVDVTVRAPGYIDEPLKINDSVPATVDIWLQSQKPEQGKERPVGQGMPGAGQGAPTALPLPNAPPPMPGRPPPTPLPNPY